MLLSRHVNIFLQRIPDRNQSADVELTLRVCRLIYAQRTHDRFKISGSSAKLGHA